MYKEFTKVCFCERCFQKDSPRNLDECLVVLTNGQNILYKYENLRRLERVKLRTRGFTPHIYTMTDRTKKYVEYSLVCGICILRDIGEDLLVNGGFSETVEDILRIRIAQWKMFTKQAILI